MKNLLASFILCFLASSISAQSIKGIIRDSQSHELLPYTSVALLKAADSSQVKGTLSDDNGNYHFENIIKGHYLLAAQLVGYAKIIVPVTIDSTLQADLQLIQLQQHLKEVTITASKPLIEHHADKLVFNIENSVVSAGNNGLELLKMAPLVTITPNNGISLKGKDNVMVMLDGKIVPVETVSSLLQGMSSEQIAKIELITNPSAKYDAAATGGIINIISKKGTNMGLNGTASLSASQSKYGRYNGSVALNYRNEKLNIYGNINLRAGKAYRNESLTRYLQSGADAITMETPMELFGNIHAQTAKIGIDYNINETSIIGFTYDGLFSQSDNRVSAISYFRNYDGVLDSVLTSASTPGADITLSTYNLNYKKKFNTKGEELTTSLTHSRYNNITEQKVTGEMVAISGNKPIAYLSSNNRNTSAFNISTFQTDYTHPFSANATLEAGLKDVYTSSNNESANTSTNFLANPTDLNNTQYTENILAGYLNLSQQLKSVKLQIGLRAEHTNAELNLTGSNNSYLNLFPSALIENKFSDKYQLSLSYSSRIDRPGYQSLIPFVIPIDRYTQEKGNPDLKAAYANSLELTNTFGNVALTVGYTHTRNAITDYIEQDELTKIWSFTKSNFDKMENYNVSLVIPITITKWWNTNNTLFGANNIFTKNDIGGSTFNKSKFSYNINSINTFSLPKDFKAEIIASYNSASIYGLYYISHYSMVNAGVSKMFFDKKATVKVGVNDIFYSTGYTIRTDAGNIRSTGSNYTDSRRVTLSLVYRFGRKITPARQSAGDESRNRLKL